MKTTNQHIIDLINQLARSTMHCFGKRLVSVYVMGSLARGDFSELTSDIDLGIVLNGPLQATDQDKIDDIKKSTMNTYPMISNDLSIFWGSIDSINGLTKAGRYPPFDRLDLIDHALLMTGTDIKTQLIRPTKQELEVAGAEFALRYLGNEDRIHEFTNCDLISKKGATYISKTVLFPARFIYLERTGNIAGNDVSHQYYIDTFSGPDAELVKLGYQWRSNTLPENTSFITNQLDQGLILLYQNFIDIYTNTMASYSNNELRASLIEWKHKITIN